MQSYANLHFALEELRVAASTASSSSSESLGPRVLVVGPTNAGKTSLVKLLSSYASRAGRVPIVANVDPSEGFLTLPGTVSAAALDSVVDVEEGWGSSPTSGPQPLPVKLPLVYCYGLQDPDTQPELFKPMARRLALAVRERMEKELEVKHAGCVIDSAASMSAGKGNYDIIQHVVAEFQGAQATLIKLVMHMLMNVVFSKRPRHPWLGAALQRHDAPFRQVHGPELPGRGQVGPLRRLRRPRRRVSSTTTPGPGPVLLFWQSPAYYAQPAYPGRRLRRRYYLPCRGAYAPRILRSMTPFSTLL